MYWPVQRMQAWPGTARWLRQRADSNAPAAESMSTATPAVDYGNEMGDGDVVKHVAGDGPVDTGENEVAVEGLAVGVLVLHALGYRADADVAGGCAANRPRYARG